MSERQGRRIVALVLTHNAPQSLTRCLAAIDAQAEVPEEVVVVDSRLDRWTEILAGLPGQVMTVVCGHTHMPFTRLAHGRLIVNPGSVGMPYGRAGAHWALLADGAVTLRRTGYDIEAARAAVHDQSDYPDVVEWTDYFLYSRATDAEALAAFAPRDGRPPAEP